MTKKKKKTILCPLCKGLPRRFVAVPWEAIGLKGSELATYVSIRSFKNSKTGKCFPSMRTIAKRASLSRKTISGGETISPGSWTSRVGTTGTKARVLVPRSRGSGSEHPFHKLAKGAKFYPLINPISFPREFVFIGDIQNRSILTTGDCEIGISLILLPVPLKLF